MTQTGFLRKLSELIFRDLGLKLVSLVAALIAYSMVHGVQDAQRTFSVDLVALTPPVTKTYLVRLAMTCLDPSKCATALRIRLHSKTPSN